MESLPGIKEQRLQELHNWQKFYNMTPREDSLLTPLYVEGKVRMAAEEVARELMATHFIFQNTLYGEFIEEFLRHLANLVKEEYGISWKMTWEIVRFYGPVALKLMMLMECGVRIPERLPPPPDFETGGDDETSMCEPTSPASPPHDKDVTGRTKWADMMDDDE